MEKNFVALLLEGAPIIGADNINGAFRSDILSQAVERPMIRPRATSAKAPPPKSRTQ